MSIRILAFAWLAVVSVATAAPPKEKPAKTPPATEPSSDAIDVDAMARAKDVGAEPPSDADATPANAAPAESANPAVENAPAEAPESASPAETATSPAPESASPAAPAETASAAVPESAPPSAPAAATPSQSDLTEKSLAAGCVSRATSLLDDAEKANYDDATRDFDAKMRSALPAPKLKDAWESLGRFGKLVARGETHLGTGEGYTLVMIPLIFEKGNLVAQVACGSDGRIAGFHVTPAPKPQF